jgi:predicted metal-dependent hydrolase
MPKVSIAGGEVEYTVRRGASSRYVYLRFKDGNKLEVVLPRCSKQDPDRLVAEKRLWIERKYRQLVARKPLLDGGKMLYRGLYRLLEFAPSGQADVRVEEGRIVVLTPPGFDSTVILNRWLVRRAEDSVVSVAPKHAERLGLRLREIRVRNIGMWGYCNRRGVLVFSWQIITLPENLAEYLVAHEVAHLVEFNHSKRFRQTLASLCPDFRGCELLLKTFEPPFGSKPPSSQESLPGERA